MTLIHHDHIERLAPATLKPYAGNARTHSKKQIQQIARSIERFGFTNPVLIDDANGIIAGHGRVLAAKLIGLEQVPCLRLSHLTETEKRAYVLADNKLALNAGWDKELLAIELQGLIEADYQVEVTGFSIGEVDAVLQEAREASPTSSDSRDDACPEPSAVAVTRAGDIWQLGRHRLICGDAQDASAYAQLLDGDKVDAVFTDPPYNVKIDGHVSGLGATKHREFAFASGEMSKEVFTTFLTTTLGHAAAACGDGAIAFVCMDWRHMGELITAGEAVFTELKNVCVWNKSNGGMGTFYRSKHEMIFVFKVGTAPHTNTFGLGDEGRYRTNVWDYAGVNTMKKGRMEELEMHPTVKPVALVADAILDVTRRGALVLDPFGGSGTTLIAAEKTGRTARLIEFDPHYCDVIVRRFEAYTGKRATLAATGAAFEEVAEARAGGTELR
ncbi:MAG: site-specific DNA-methyltransferase [Hyphomicrobiaceae bacterium]|jgi:DNA modification methylase|nr:site-specific DNA-methyltransferase [Hyphomicrobiaceae bacterium]